jgi:hypothetical protein
VRTEAVPDGALGFGQVLSQRASTQAHLWLDAPFGRAARSPLPTLPRKRGRGSTRRVRPLNIANCARGGRCTERRARASHPLNPPASVGKSSGRKP